MCAKRLQQAFRRGEERRSLLENLIKNYGLCKKYNKSIKNDNGRSKSIITGVSCKLGVAKFMRANSVVARILSRLRDLQVLSCCIYN